MPRASGGFIGWIVGRCAASSVAPSDDDKGVDTASKRNTVRRNSDKTSQIWLDSGIELISMGKQISPDGWIKLTIRKGSGEGVIKDKMVLRSDGSRGWVKDQMNSGGVKGTNPQIDTSVAPHGPFWNLLGILETRIKYNDQAPKYVSTLQMMVIMEGSGSEQFCKGDDLVSRGHVVP